MYNFIFDLDGTLADHSHRAHLAPLDIQNSTYEDWADFNEASYQDPVIQGVYKIYVSHLKAAANQNDTHVHILTARNSSVREITEHWLKVNHIDAYDSLIMRDKYDMRSSAEFKLSMARSLGWTPQNSLIYEDTDSVVKTFRDAGYTVCQVASNPY